MRSVPRGAHEGAIYLRSRLLLGEAVRPLLHAGVVTYGRVEAHQLREVVEDGGRDVVDHAAREPAHDHVELQIDDVDLRTAEERSVAELLLDVRGPGREVRRGERL